MTCDETVGKHKFKVGVVDFAFCPYPAGGDNYRFLITLEDGSGTDVRNTKENGRAVELRGMRDDLIPKPLAYTTGRFIIWKRMFIKLVVLVNDAPKSAINWAFIQGIYRKSFVDIVPPSDPGGYFTLIAARWIDELKAVFTSGADQAASTPSRPPPRPTVSRRSTSSSSIPSA